MPSRQSPLADGDGRRAPAATSQTAPIMSRKHGGRPHKPHKQSTAKARKAALAAHGGVTAAAGIAAMHEAHPVEEQMPLTGDVVALPIAKHGTVDDEIQDKIIWLESQLDAFGSHGIVGEMFKLVSNARLTQGVPLLHLSLVAVGKTQAKEQQLQPLHGRASIPLISSNPQICMTHTIWATSSL